MPYTEYNTLDMLTKLKKNNCEYISGLEKSNLQSAKRIAELSALTKELEMNRKVIEKYFSIRIKEKESLYDVANKVLDKAIISGNVEIAKLAAEQIRFIKSIHF